ncbi:MAG: aspartyl protease family protein [Sphingomonas sp.]|uniref:aspartyl protease family protein n=1 Tax=Sphingomonas sp. TaxID=28214 RepID=UPI003F7F835B
MSATSLIALLGALAAPAPPANKCRADLLAQLPVTMARLQPMVDARFGDKTARFILDSGAFYSTISRASAAEYGLKVESAPPWFRLMGIGGDTSAGVANTDQFWLAGIKLPKVSFIVGGSDMGATGLLGQNILGLADVEYDLPHGAVRLLKTVDCARSGLAYWAGDKPFTMVELEGKPDGVFKPHTIGTILLNGVKIKAVFDSGAQSSLLSLSTAKRLGITPGSPGVEFVGEGSGLGTHRVPTWLATFDKIDIGGETIPRPKIRITQLDLENADMLIGVDFFLTHRMFVSNTTHRMFITYEGGPVFGLSPRQARSSDGKVLDLTDKAPEPTSADEFSRRGATFASNRKLTEALADFDKAIALAPKESRYAYQRAMARFANGDRSGGLADLDRTIALAPDNADARLYRAQMRLRDGNIEGATEDVRAADRALAPSADKRLVVASLYDSLGTPDAALPNYDLWLKSHPEDSSRGIALNGRCWVRGLLNRDLDKALEDCNAAVRAQPRDASILDSRALIRVRRGEMKQAMADYNAALAINPRAAWSLYMRGIVEAKTGQAAQAKADRAAAIAIDPKVVDRARKYGLES